MVFIVLEAFFILLAALCSDVLAVTVKPSLLERDVIVDGDQATLAQLSLSSDRQSYYLLLKTGLIPFRVAIDTGSADIWLASSDCKTETCNRSPHYPLRYQNPTFVTVNGNTTTFKAKYADGTSAVGFVAKETITIGNLTAQEQAIGIVSDSSLNFPDSINGILGLGFPRLSTINRTLTDSSPFMATLAENGLLRYPLFALYLTEGSTGSISFGAIDSSIVKKVDDIVWMDVVQFSPLKSESAEPSYWQWAAPLTEVFVNNDKIQLAPTYPDMTGGASIALFDVGTSGIYGPWGDLAKIYTGIPEARLVDTNGQWAVPCDTNASLTFSFGPQKFSLRPADYIIGPTAGNPSLCLSWPRATIPTPDGIDWILGAPFLRTVYSIFSYGINTKEPPMIGLYALNTSTTVVSTMVVPTTLPNSLLKHPRITTTAPYGLNASFTAPTGAIVTSGLANSTYSAILGKNLPTTNLSALPSFATPTTTPLNGSGSRSNLPIVETPAATVKLGVPPGWIEDNGASSARWDVFTLLLILSSSGFSYVLF